MFLQGDQSTLFSDDPWKVQIRLRAEDEEVRLYYISINELPIFLCERKPGNRSPVNYFISSNGLFSRAN